MRLELACLIMETIFLVIVIYVVNPQCSCARVIAVTLSVCLSLYMSAFYFGEGAFFRVEIYISTF